MAIGLLAVGAQVLRSQEAPSGGNGTVGWIGAKEEQFRDRFRQLLLAVPTRDLPGGWQLAADLGRPAVPLLWEMMEAENSNVDRRLVMLAAALLAGGPVEDERLFTWLDRHTPMLEVRVLAAMLLALGPGRQRPIADFWARCHGPAKSPPQVLAIAVRLAAARFPGLEGGAPTILDDDAGVLAATVYAGSSIAVSSANRLWNLRNPERHADLFWRGSLLAGARRLAAGVDGQDALLARARDLMVLPGDHNAPVRAAAVLFRLRARDLRGEGARPDWRLLQVAVSETAGARALRGWLGPAVQPRDEEVERLAVAYVLSREVAEVVADRTVWSADPRIARHVAVALAFRLLGEPSPGPIDLQVADVPEWSLVRWASGASIESAAAIADPQLQVALGMAAAGRMPRPALRVAVEEALWRWGSHPGLAAWEQERLFVRDLLLVGSNQGGSKYQPLLRPEQRYRPAGIGPDDSFFKIAVALFDVLARQRGPLPLEHRLR